jgi:SAM-dependent methyltransferase
MGLFRRANSRRTLDVARQYFTEEELSTGKAHGDTLTMFDAVFRRKGGGLLVESVPDDAWLRDYVSTKRGGGAPYVGYPLELNGFEGNFVSLAGELIANFAPNRVLDVGCATGHLVKAIRDLGVEVEGIDYSEWAVNNAVTPVVQGSALDLPWEREDFDLVISQDFMEHMHPDDLPKVIAEQVRVTRAGGAIAHLIPFYDTDPPVQVDAHLCQATKDWWMRFLRAQPGIEIAHEPRDEAPALLDRYVHLRRV